MKIWLALTAAIFSLQARAQFSVQEADGNNRIRILGREFSPNFFSLAATETDKFNDEGGRISTYNYLTLRTWASNSYRPLIRIPFQYNTAGTDRFDGDKQNKQDIFLQDIILGLMKSDLLFLPWDIGLYWEGRVYLPTSQNSSRSGLITRLRNNFIFSKALTNKFELEYDNKFSYFFQSRTANAITFRDEFDFEQTGVVSLTKKMEIEHRLSLWGKITPKVGLGWQVGAKDQFYNKSKAEARAKPGNREVKMGPQIRFPLNDSVNFIFSYEDVTTRENSQALGKFMAENTQFVLNSFVRF